MSMYESIQRRYGYRELNVAKWNDPRGSVHPARGGPRASVVAADSAGKVYQPTYKVSYRRPPPQATDDEESEDEVKSAEAASASKGVDASTSGSVLIDLPDESQEPTVIEAAPEKTESEEIEDGTMIEKDVQDVVPAPNDVDSIATTSEPEQGSLASLQTDSPGVSTLVEDVSSSAEEKQDELEVPNEGEPVPVVAEVVPVVAEPEVNTEPSCSLPEDITSVSVAAEDPEQRPPDEGEDDQEPGASVLAQASASEEVEQVGGIGSSTDTIDGETENSIPPPVPDPPCLEAHEPDPADIPGSQENETALDASPVVPEEGTHTETESPIPKLVETLSEPVLDLSIEPSAKTVNDELTTDVDAQRIPVSVEPSADVEEPANVDVTEEIAAAPIDQVQTTTDITEDRESPIVTAENPQASTPEAQIEESEDKKVSWAPDTPEPKPTVRKKKSSKGSKSKTKRKLMIREDRDPQHISETLDIEDSIEVPVSPLTPPRTCEGLHSTNVGAGEESVSTKTPTSDEQVADDKHQLPEDAGPTPTADQASQTLGIETLAVDISTPPLPPSPPVIEDSARVSASNADDPEKESEEKGPKSSKEKDKSKRKSSLKSKGGEQNHPVETKDVPLNGEVVDKHPDKVVKDIPSSAVPTEVEKPQTKDDHAKSPLLADSQAHNEAVLNSTPDAASEEGMSVLLSEGLALAGAPNLTGDSAPEASATPQMEALTPNVAPAASLVVDTDSGGVDPKTDGEGIPPDDESNRPTQTSEPITMSRADSIEIDSMERDMAPVKANIEETGDDMERIHQKEQLLIEETEAIAVMSEPGEGDLPVEKGTEIEVEADSAAKSEVGANEHPVKGAVPGENLELGGEAESSNGPHAAEQAEIAENVEFAEDVKSTTEVEAVVEGETLGESEATMETDMAVEDKAAVASRAAVENKAAVESEIAVENGATADIVPATVVEPVTEIELVAGVEPAIEVERKTQVESTTGPGSAADTELAAEIGPPAAEICSPKDAQPVQSEEPAEIASGGGSAVASFLETGNALRVVDTLDGTATANPLNIEETLTDTHKSSENVNEIEIQSNTTGNDEAVVNSIDVEPQIVAATENGHTDARPDTGNDAGDAEDTAPGVQDPATRDFDVGNNGQENEIADSEAQNEDEMMAADILASKQNSEDFPGEDIVEEAIAVQGSSNMPADDNENVHRASETNHQTGSKEEAYTDGQHPAQAEAECKDNEEISVQTHAVRLEPVSQQAKDVDIIGVNETQATTDSEIGAGDAKAEENESSTTSGDPPSVIEQSEVIVEEMAGPADDTGLQDATKAKKLPETSDPAIEDSELMAPEEVKLVTHLAENESTSSAIESEGLKDASGVPNDALGTISPTLIPNPTPPSNPTPLLAETKDNDTLSSADVVVPGGHAEVVSKAFVAATDEDNLSNAGVQEPEIGPSLEPTVAEPESPYVSKDSKTEDPALAPVSTSFELAVKTDTQTKVVQGEDTTKGDSSVNMLPIEIPLSTGPEDSVDASLGKSVERVQSSNEKSGTLPVQEDVVEPSDHVEKSAALETTQVSPSGEKALLLVHDLAQVEADVNDNNPDMVAEPVAAAAAINSTTTNVTEEAATQVTSNTTNEAVSTTAGASPVVLEVPEPQPVLVVPPSPTTGKQRSSKHHTKHGERSTKSATHDGKPARSVGLPKLARKQASRNLVQEPSVTHIRKPTRVSMTAVELAEQAERRRRRAARKAAETARILEAEQKLAYESEQRLERAAEERRVRREAHRSEKKAIVEEANRRAREEAESAALMEAEYRRRRRRDSVREQDVRPSTRDSKSGLFSLPRSFTGESANKVPSFTRAGTGGARSSGNKDHRTRPTSSRYSVEGQPELKTPHPKDNSPKDNSPKDNSPKDNSPKDNSPKDNSPKDNSPKDNSPKDNSPKDNKVPADSSAKDITGDTKHKSHRRHRHRSSMERPRSDGKQRDRASSSLKGSNEPLSSRKDGDRRPPTTPVKKEEKKKKPGLFGRLFG